MSEYLGQPASSLPDGGFHDHEPGRWCVVIWDGRGLWLRRYGGRRGVGHTVGSWKRRETAVKRFQEFAKTLMVGQRLALIDGEGLVQAYVELGPRELAAQLSRIDWHLLAAEAPQIVIALYREICGRLREAGLPRKKARP